MKVILWSDDLFVGEFKSVKEMKNDSVIDHDNITRIEFVDNDEESVFIDKGVVFTEILNIEEVK